MEELKIQESLEVLKQVKTNENMTLDDIEREFERISNIFDYLDDNDYAKIINYLCKKYSKEELAEIVLRQMITLKFNELNLEVYKLLKKTFDKTREERLEELKKKQREVFYIIYNDILKDEKILSNLKDVTKLNNGFIDNLIKHNIKYPIKIKINNYGFSEYTKNVILDKLRNYIEIVY